MRRLRILRPPPNVLTALSGAFVWAGQNATLIKARHLVATLNTRAFTWSGASATFTNGPKLLSATIQTTGNTINLVFSQAVRIGAGGGAGFSLALTGGLETLTYSSGTNSATLVYNLSRQVGQGETGTISYTATVDGIETLTGNDLQAMSRAIANSSTYTGPPVLLSAVVPAAGTSLTLNFDKAVLPGSVTNSGLVLALSGGSFSGATLTYTSTGATSLVFALGGRTVIAGETGTLNYTQPAITAERIKATLGGADVATFSSGVTNSSSITIPTPVSAVIPAAGTTLSLTFSQAVNPGTVTNAGLTLTMSGGSFSGATLTFFPPGGGVTLVFTLGGRTVGPGETGTIAYVQPVTSADRIKATAGGSDVASFNQAVIASTDIPSTAAHVYVKAASTGTASGADWTNAVGFTSVTFARNTTYWIADGAYTSKTCSTPNNGSNYIVIRKATTTDHGTETGWSPADGDGQAIFTGQFSVQTDFWWIDGRIRNSVWQQGSTTAYGFRIVSNGSKTLRIDNGGSGGGANDCTFKYIDLVGAGRDSDGQDVIYSLYRNKRINVQMCALRDCGRCQWISAGGTLDRLVEYCYLARNTSTPTVHSEPFSCWGNDANSIYRYNYIEDCEGSAVWAFINAGAATNTRIYGNLIQFTASYASTSGSRPTHTVGFVNALFVGDNISGGNGNTMSGLRYYNNTHYNFAVSDAYYDSPGGVDIQHYGEILPIGGSDNEVRNNIWSVCRKAAHIVSGSVTYNYYHSTTVSGDGGSSQTSAVSPFVSAATGNFSLVVPTDAGYTLASPYNTDANGVVRGADGVWDRGAFDYVSVSDPGALANDRYVRPGASGSGSGLDWTNALTSLPASMTRNTTYWLADGSYGSYVCNTAASGSTRIRIKKATAALHGTNTGWNPAYDSTAATFGSFTVQTPYWVIDGSRRTESNTYAAPAGYGIRASSIGADSSAAENASYSEFRYIELGGAWNPSPSAGVIDGYSWCVRLVYNQASILFHRCAFHNGNWALMGLHGANGVTVEYCFFAHGWGKEAIAGPNVGVTNLVVRYSRFYNSTQKDPNDDTGGTTAEIGFFGYGLNCTGNQIYGNWFSSTVVGMRNSCVVFGNLGEDGIATNCKVFNNTFAGVVEAASAGMIRLTGGSGNEVRNNLFYDCGSNGVSANAVSNNVTATVNPFVDYVNKDYRITASSQARNVGTALSTTYNTDPLGATRGADGTWDVGAFEYL